MTDVSSRPHPSAVEEIRRGILNVAVPHNEPPSIVRRRRIVVVIVLLLGAAALGLALRRHPGEPSFYWWSLVLAAVWAIGALASGPLHLGGVRWRGRNQRPVISGTVVGLVLGGVFVVGGLIAREIPAVSELITRVLHYTDQGSWRLTMTVALLGGIAEELFYRGALYTALGPAPSGTDLDRRVRGRHVGQRQSDARFRRDLSGHGVRMGAPRHRRCAGTDLDPLRVEPGRAACAAPAVRSVNSRISCR